jgi:hypothetical protein
MTIGTSADFRHARRALRKARLLLIFLTWRHVAPRARYRARQWEDPGDPRILRAAHIRCPAMSPLSVAERSARYRERERALSSGRPANALVRAVTAQLLSASDNYRTAADIIISRSWPSDAAAAMVVKAASGTATTTTVTPAMLVADFLDVLAGASAGAAALAHGLQLRADVGYQFMFPIISEKWILTRRVQSRSEIEANLGQVFYR